MAFPEYEYNGKEQLVKLPGQYGLAFRRGKDASAEGSGSKVSDGENREAFEKVDEEVRDGRTWEQYNIANCELLGILIRSVSGAAGVLLDEEVTGPAAWRRLKDKYGYISLHEGYSAYLELFETVSRRDETPKEYLYRQDECKSRIIQGGLDPPSDEVMGVAFLLGL